MNPLPVTRFEVGTRPGFADPRGVSVARKIREHLGIAVAGVRTRDVFHVDAELSPEDARRVCNEFAGAVVRQGALGRLEDGPFDSRSRSGSSPA